MIGFLKPKALITPLADEKVDSVYQKQRWKIFFGIFIGYAAYYLVRKNFTLIMPDLIAQGYTKSELGWVLAAISIAYGTSKFIMGSVLVVVN